MPAPVQNKRELIERILSNSDQVLSYGVARLGIFGSFVRDEAVDNSDVDFMVEFAPGMKTFDNFMELAFYLEELTGRKIELLTPQSLSKYIGPYILKELENAPLAA